MSEPDTPRTVADTLARVDEAWQEFHQRALSFPAERLDERLRDGWSRKQMLAHLAAWHDNANERLGSFLATGQKQPLADDIDVFNSRTARAAEGRTVGEIYDALEASFRRLRRQIGHLTDGQLAALDGWPAAVIAANTYDHYEEHLSDLDAAGG